MLMTIALSEFLQENSAMAFATRAAAVLGDAGSGGRGLVVARVRGPEVFPLRALGCSFGFSSLRAGVEAGSYGNY